MRYRVFALVTILAAAVVSAGALASDVGSFAVRVRSMLLPYPVHGLFVMPGETLKLEVEENGPEETYRIRCDSGALRADGRRAWIWTAPAERGLYPVKVVRERDGETVLLNVFVKVPSADIRGERLNGYRIGGYPERPLRGLPIYLPPSGFVEVTAENADTLVSPHFRLDQFLCKQQGEFPKYAVLEEKLVLALELILARASERGWATSGLHVMSGYRTPFYNEAIGNVPYSRHVWGGAADIFIDEKPRDGVMDDLDGDGKSGLDDATVLYDFIDRLLVKPIHRRFMGGLGRYKANAAHGPFVHVDVRGTPARWGR